MVVTKDEKAAARSYWDGFRDRVLFAANTNDVIVWKGLRERLARSPPGLSELEHCRVMLALVNGKAVSGRLWNQLVGATIISGADELPSALPDSAREGFAGNLACITDGTDKDIAELAAAAAEAVSQHVILCLPPVAGGAPRVVASGAHGALAYGLSLMLDPKKPFRSALRRCQYSQCNAFFFKWKAKSGKGRPAAVYCSASHTKLGTLEKAKERMAKLRRSRK